MVREHFVSGSCEGVVCGHADLDGANHASDGVRICGQPATHKVGEVIMHDDPNPNRHNLTMYVCCKHFGEILGSWAREICAQQ